MLNEIFMEKESKMKILKVLLMMLLVSMVACSGSKKKSVEESAIDEVSESQIESLDEDADFIVDGEDEEVIPEATEESVENIAEVSGPVEEMASSEVVAEVSDTAGVGEYTVQKDDTLMLVAFKIYGDYLKWREIAAMNSAQGVNISEGMVLKYKIPSKKFVWNPKGLPHLIKRGETLGTISEDKYGTVNKWKTIWYNNRPLIQDPNLIFAGFTIHYLTDRELASEL